MGQKGGDAKTYQKERLAEGRGVKQKAHQSGNQGSQKKYSSVSAFPHGSLGKGLGGSQHGLKVRANALGSGHLFSK